MPLMTKGFTATTVPAAKPLPIAMSAVIGQPALTIMTDRLTSVPGPSVHQSGRGQTPSGLRSLAYMRGRGLDRQEPGLNSHDYCSAHSTLLPASLKSIASCSACWLPGASGFSSWWFAMQTCVRPCSVQCSHLKLTMYMCYALISHQAKAPCNGLPAQSPPPQLPACAAAQPAAGFPGIWQPKRAPRACWPAAAGDAHENCVRWQPQDVGPPVLPRPWARTWPALCCGAACPAGWARELCCTGNEELGPRVHRRASLAKLIDVDSLCAPDVRGCPHVGARPKLPMPVSVPKLPDL